MTRRAQGPDGTVFEFPDNTADDVVSRTIRTHYERQQPGYQAARGREERIEQARPTSTIGRWADQVGYRTGIQDEFAGGIAAAGQFGSNLLRRARGEEIETTPQQAFHAASDVTHERGQRYARAAPGADLGATAATIPLFMGRAGPVAQMPALQAGAGFAAMNAPFAVARQEGTLAERLPRAAPEVATSFVIGAGGQALANSLTRGGSAAAQRAQEFEAAGVRPTMAAVAQGPTAAATRIASESLVGGSTQRALQASIDDTQRAAERIGQGYGAARPREIVGENVREGVRRFAQDGQRTVGTRTLRQAYMLPTRDWSFAAKAEVLYDEILGIVNRAERSVPEASARDSMRELDSILGRVSDSSPNIANIVNDSQLVRLRDALGRDAEHVRFGDLRALRTWVREAQRNPQLRQGIDDAALQRLEGALTRDIYWSAEAIAGTQVLHALRRADQFYRAGMQRINTALRPFGPQGGTGASAYDRILSMASERGGTNTQALQSLRRSLKPDEWRQVAASIVDRLGMPSPGTVGATQDGAFSINAFVTNWNRLSPEGRRVLFEGPRNAGGSLLDDLNNLARVADYQKGVEQLANHSRSGIHGTGFATLGGLGTGALLTATGNPAPLLGVLAGLATVRLTGEMLTNPAFVRWMVSAPRAGQTVGGAREHLARLAQLASRDPALMPAYTSLSQSALSSVRGPQDRPQRRTEASPRPEPTRVLETTGQ